MMIYESSSGTDGTGAYHFGGMKQALRIAVNASLPVGLDVPHSRAAQLMRQRESGNSDDQEQRLQ